MMTYALITVGVIFVVFTAAYAFKIWYLFNLPSRRHNDEPLFYRNKKDGNQ